MRYKKSIKGIKSGGDVQYIAYTSVEGQLLNVLQKVKTLNMPELQKTVICYRNQECSMVLSQILAENHIQHYVISGYHAYSHELYRHIIDILFILSRPRDTYAQLNLYKILPIKREAVQQILKYDNRRIGLVMMWRRRILLRLIMGSTLHSEISRSVYLC